MASHSRSSRTAKETLALDGLAWALIGANLGLHLLALGRFGLHRDEFLYAEMGHHLAVGYKETAPLIGFISWLGQILFGKTILALRFFPALFSSGTLALCLAMVARLGGSRLATVFCSLAYILSPVLLAFGHLFQPNFLEAFFWALTSFTLLRALDNPSAARSAAFVLALCLGLWAKFSFLYYGAFLGIGLMADGRGRTVLLKGLRNGWWVGLLLLAPLLIWQWLHHWPFVQHMRLLRETQLVHTSLRDFLVGQLLMHLPGLPLWPAALPATVAHPRLKAMRPFAIQWGLLIVFLGITGGKLYYAASAYLPLFAVGAVWMEEQVLRRLYLMALPVGAALASLIVMPIVLPVLNEDAFLSYAAWARRQTILEGVFRWEDGTLHDLPQDYADEMGWEELAPLVEQAMAELPEGGRRKCLVVGDSYGQAGAANWYQAPGAGWQAVSTHGSFSLWNTVPDSVRYLIYLNEGDGPEDLFVFFGKHRLIGRVQASLARTHGAEVFLMENPKPGAIEYIRRRIDEAKEGFE